MSRDTMVYYRSFRESLRELPPDLYKVVSETIFDYAFEGIAPGPDSNAPRCGTAHCEWCV